jgi:hypothetical protein
VRDVPLPAPDIDGSTARQTAEEVLRRPEYAGAEPGLLDRIGDRISQLLGEVLAGLSGTATGALLGYLILALLAVGVAVVVHRTVRGFRRDAVAGVATPADVGRPPATWAADAAAHEAAGRWRDAIRCRYRELVAALASRGVVEEVAGRTAGEYVEQIVTSSPAAAEPFRAATALFERAWYGSEEVGGGDLADSRARAADTLAAVDRERGGARRLHAEVGT